MTHPSSGPVDTSTRVCPVHGLRFDPAISTGCIRCRASSRPSASVESGARMKVLAVLLASLIIVAGGAWFAYDRLSTPRPGARHFTNQQLLEEARHVRVVIYSATWCPSCDVAKSFLWKNDIPFEEHDIDKEKDARDHWVTLNPAKTIPVIDIEGNVVVGADAEPIIRALLRASDRHLAAAAATE